MIVAWALAASGENGEQTTIEREFVIGEGRGDRDGAEQGMGKTTNLLSCFHHVDVDVASRKSKLRAREL
jgi:hypothetical protein